MTNLSKIKRERMLQFLETLRGEHTDDDSIRAFTEIENQLREKKYGLVWEEHTELVDNMLKDNIPVLCEDKNRKITGNAELPYNFLIEGNNLQSLYLLEKTHKGKIDLIYIEIIVPYMIRLRFRDFVKECKNLLIYRLSHTEGCAEGLFFCLLFSTDYFERVQVGVHAGDFAHPYNDGTPHNDLQDDLL